MLDGLYPDDAAEEELVAQQDMSADTLYTEKEMIKEK